MAKGLHIWRLTGKVRAMPFRAALLLVFTCLAACTEPGGSGPVVTLPDAPEAPAAAEQDGPLVSDDIRIAVVLPLTGPEARLGDAMAKAVELAFFQAADSRINLRFFDSAGSKAALESRAIFADEVAAYEPAAVIGPLFSENAQAIAPLMLERGVPVLSFSNDMAANAAGAILLGQQPEQEIARVLTHVASQMPTRRLGLIVPDDVYGTRVETAAAATLEALNAVASEEYELLLEREHEKAELEAAVDAQMEFFESPEGQGVVGELARQALEELESNQNKDQAPSEGADEFISMAVEEDEPLEPLVLYSITVSERYPRDLRELDIPARRVAQFYRREQEMVEERAFLTELDDPMGLDYLDYIRNIDTFGQPPYDALIVAEGGQMLRALAPLLNVYSIDEKQIRFVGTGLWNDPALSREPALHGGLFATAVPASGAAFAQRYADSYGGPPPPLAAVAYDAMAMLALAARDDAGALAVFAPQRLFAESGFRGASGLMRITPSGITERTLAVMQITESGLVTIEDAPGAFEPYERPAPSDPVDPVSR